jgi:hypothetical protein
MRSRWWCMRPGGKTRSAARPETRSRARRGTRLAGQEGCARRSHLSP